MGRGMGKNAKSKSRETQEFAELAVIENSKWVDRVLWTQAAVGLTVVIGKFMGVTEFEWQHVKFNVSTAWFVFLLLTIAHLYASLLLIKSLRRFWDCSDAHSRRALFAKITATGGIFVRGLVARTEYDGTLFVRYRMSPSDPSAWAALMGSAFLVASIIPFSLSKSMWWMLLVAFAITQVNWSIGSHWVIALSDLTNNSSVYFPQVEGRGIRVLSIGSGANMAFARMSFFALPLWLALNAVLFVPQLLIFILMGLVRFWDKLREG
jgi:hypothetical protein